MTFPFTRRFAGSVRSTPPVRAARPGRPPFAAGHPACSRRAAVTGGVDRTDPANRRVKGKVMKAIRYYRYGPPDVLALEDVDTPVATDDEVLVRVRAASVNPADFHYMRGTPYLVRAVAGLSRPKVNGLGLDLAGYVEAVGKNVTTFQPGDEVFGQRLGAFAEYVRIRHDGGVLTKPANLTFEQAASVPVAGFSALQALRDKGRTQAGHKVLVNGAAGGVGTFAVQIAKAFG